MKHLMQPAAQPAPPHSPGDGIVTFNSIVVVPWLDPLVDAHGYPVEDAYVEMFWLPILGPTATWLLRRLAGGFTNEPEGYTADLADLARSIGVAHSPGRHGPFARALHRCTMFGVAHQVASRPVTEYAVRRTVPRIARRHLDRLPESMHAIHDSWPAFPREPHPMTGTHLVGHRPSPTV